MYDINNEMKEIIKFFKMKKGYWVDSILYEDNNYPITSELQAVHNFKCSLFDKSIKNTHKFTVIKEADFLNNFLSGNLNIEEIIQYDLDIAYFIASLNTKYEDEKIKLLKRSINCQNGQILVPEAFMELIKIFSKKYFMNKNSDNLIKVLKCFPYLKLLVTTNKDEDIIEEILTTLYEYENPSNEILTNEKVLSYINILNKIGFKEFIFLLDENKIIKEGIEILDFDYPEKFVNVTLINSMKENINIPYDNILNK